MVAEILINEFPPPQGYVDFDSTLGQPIYVLPSEASQRPRIVSQTVLSNRIILNVGDFPLIDEEGNEIDLHPVTYDETGAAVTAPRYPDLVTLIVTPQEAVTLNFLIYSGAQLTLALRSPTDAEVIETNSVTLNYFMNTYSVPLPDKLPYGITPSINELAPPELPNGLH
jgi:pilus assembly protein CpaB